MGIIVFFAAKTPSPTTAPPARLNSETREYIEIGRAVSRIARGDSDSMTSGYSKSAPTQDGTNRLLQLPGEIRNTIYEYALTANHHELFYRDSIDFDTIPQAVTEEVNSIDDIWHATPQECVDAYYEHESAQGVKLCSTAESTSEFNQLKYVCKQLYKETKHLSLLYNDIVFAQDNVCAQNATHQFIRFVRQCDKSWTSQVKTVEIRPLVRSKDERVDVGGLIVKGHFDELRITLADPCHKLNLLADYCIENPRVHVRFRLLAYGPLCLMYHEAALFQRRLPSVFYGNGTCVPFGNHLRVVNDHCKTLAVRLSQCRNFRLFLTKEEAFDEQKLRRCMVEHKFFRRHILPLRDGGLEECIEGRRSIFLEGV